MQTAARSSPQFRSAAIPTESSTIRERGEFLLPIVMAAGRSLSRRAPNTYKVEQTLKIDEYAKTVALDP